MVITRDNGPALHRGNIWVEQLFYLFAPAPPQISAARNSFKHDKDYYEGLLEYYQHSSFPFPCCLLGAYFTKSPHNLYTLYTACWTQSRAREPAAGDIKNVCCWCSGQAGVNTKVGIGNIVTTVSSFCLVGSLLVGCIGNRHHFKNCDRSVPGPGHSQSWSKYNIPTIYLLVYLPTINNNTVVRKCSKNISGVTFHQMENKVFCPWCVLHDCFGISAAKYLISDEING